MSESYFMGQILFGAIGSGAALYGKNVGRAKPLLLGIVLATFGFFISDNTALWVIGGILTFALVYSKNPS